MTDGATTPIIAAGISGAVAFLAAIFTKETKTSEFRQNWIDGIRSDISELLAHANSLAFFVDSKKKYQVEEGNIVQGLYDKADDLVAFHMCRRRIILRLNPTEHIDLIKEIEILGNIAPTEITSPIVKCRADNIIRLSTNIFSKEWKRVKKGEPIFVRAKYGSLLLFVMLILYLLWPVVLSLFNNLSPCGSMG